MSRKRSAYRPKAVISDRHATDEAWRPVVGFEEAYSVSNHGRVRSERRQVPGKLGSIGSAE